jgi:hypothetical protein
MEGAIALCKQTYPPDSVSLDACIDDAQVAGFLCRLGVRKADKDALNACRKGNPELGIQGFRPCVQACLPGAGPVEDPKQCRADAAAAYVACIHECTEDFQFAKDSCRNKDHDCVEGCRTDRTACELPVRTALAQALAQCKADKEIAVGNCDPSDTTCITNALVVAFQCRDAAREAAKPGLTACRNAFQLCATNCPPAAP